MSTQRGTILFVFTSWTRVVLSFLNCLGHFALKAISQPDEAQLWLYGAGEAGTEDKAEELENPIRESLSTKLGPSA